MTRRYIIVDDLQIDAILDYCKFMNIAVFQGRSYSDANQILAWQIYCEDSHKLDLLLLKFGTAIHSYH